MFEKCLSTSFYYKQWSKHEDLLIKYPESIKTNKAKMRLKVTFVSVLWTMIVGAVDGASNLETGACEPIKVDMCKQIGYNNTGMKLFVFIS